MTSQAPEARCPICRGASRPRAENPAAPFCSQRCRTIDLGHWLLESYRIPTVASSDEDEDGGGGGGEEPV